MMNDPMNARAWSIYESGVAAARARLTNDPALRRIVDPAAPRDLLLRFLIEYSARGVQITEPVDGWIRRAGERCLALGLEDVGRALIRHAHHEADHHLMLIDDTHHLVGVWNALHPDAPLDAAALLAVGRTRAMQAYIELHERTIASDAAYAQVAIELEVEGMSTTFGPPLVAQCQAVLGPEILAGLSFVTEHVALDVGHTVLNRRMMDQVLAQRPNDAPLLADAGARALAAYIDLLGECLALADAATEQT